MSKLETLLKEAKACHNAHSIDCLIEAVKLLAIMQCRAVAYNDNLSQDTKTEMLNKIYIE